MVAGAVIPSMALAIGWQWSFIASGIACALCAYFVQPLREELDDDRDSTVQFSLVASLIDPLRLVLKHRVLRLLAACSFLFAICQMSLMAYLVTFLYEDLHWGLVTPFVNEHTSLWLLFPLLIVFGSTAIGWNGVFLAEVARQAPNGQTSMATGGSLCITFLGVVTGPSMFGVLAGSLHSYGVSYGFLAIPALIILSILISLYRRPDSAN